MSLLRLRRPRRGEGLRPHLDSITSAAGQEAYGFNVVAATVASPFAGGPSEATMALQSITNSRTNQSTALLYNASGEMTSATLPYGGLFEWEYSGFQYASQKTYREVTTRYLEATVGASFAFGGLRLRRQRVMMRRR